MSKVVAELVYLLMAFVLPRQAWEPWWQSGWCGWRIRNEIDVYRAGDALTTLSEGDTLDGGDVLPGFTCDVSDIFVI